MHRNPSAESNDDKLRSLEKREQKRLTEIAQLGAEIVNLKKAIEEIKATIEVKMI